MVRGLCRDPDLLDYNVISIVYFLFDGDMTFDLWRDGTISHGDEEPGEIVPI